ncbi:DUF6288 domain-containing protein [Haloferula sp. A504]|uniref:DUF6288 domain-containing protein n=1 Tax=Haloferula sp. A504 TaxID=3373601 RepID=UPI0031CB8D6D|nr:DUF6288 domain-containing protein [Verrucomicrobiaceae bacterium E54]
MKTIAPILLTLGCAGSLAAEPFYKNEHGLFSLRPGEQTPVTHLTRVGPIGISLDLLQPAFTMRIKGVEVGSPAAAAQLEPGMFIQSINGAKLADIDPRIQLGNWITEAEASDGRLVMAVSGEPGGEAREVVVTIPVMGEYSATWPLDCPKSEKIVRNYADYLKQPGADQGFAGLGMLFLLSTGDASDLEHVRQWARAHDGGSSYPWHIGYGGLALCEYYLRTGDAEVLPAIQKMADKLVEMENFGGWAGRGPTASLSYGGGGGHLNAAGTLCVGYLMLAKECGAEVPDETLQRVLAHFYRYSARGNVPYGKGKPEGGYTDNGKNGKLAFSMAAAAALDPRGEKSIYARARDASAQFAFYSTSYMLHGHTGGGIGEIWRSASMGLVRDELPEHYREFMDNRRWHYELSRRFDGSFGILGGARYDNTEWGAGYAFTYTVPRKTLRLTGAPPTKFSKLHALPERPWGTAEDDDFQSITPAACPKGGTYDLSAETFAGHTGMAMLRRLGGGDLDEGQLRKFIRHPDIVVRSTAARSIGHHGEALLMELLACDDARVRRAALEGLDSGADPLMSRAVFDHVIGMIDDPAESWFVKDMAIQAVGKAPKDWIVGQVDRILPFLAHEEWWLQHSALGALAPVVGDERCYEKVLPAIGKLLQTNYQYSLSGQFRWGPLPENLRSAPPKVQQLARECLKEAYVDFVEYDHHSGRVENVVNPMTREALADSLAKLPGGYDTLYQIGRQRYPDQDLPFKEIFLQADPEQLSPELRRVVDEAVGGNLIPAYVKKNRGTLLKEAVSEEVGGGKMEGLTELYRKVGVDEFDWRDFGPHPNEMVWQYHSFDPPEKFMEPDDRLGRFREVTFPSGMEEWHAVGFDPRASGWKTGQAPFGAADGEKGMIAGSRSDCGLSFCKCGDPVQTLWEKDVLLIRGTFDFPTFEEGYRYRLVHGGISHVGSGGGYQVYVNGRLFIDDQNGVDRRGGSRPIGRVIPKEWWPEFADGQVDLAAITFKKHHPRSKKYGGNISLFLQRMKVPPLEVE